MIARVMPSSFTAFADVTTHCLHDNATDACTVRTAGYPELVQTETGTGVVIRAALQQQ